MTESPEREGACETVADAALSDLPPSQQETVEPPIPPSSQTAHDLANFLTGIRMLIQSLSNCLPAELGLREHLVSLQKTAIQASALCDQLRKSLAGQQEDMDLAVQESDIGAIINSMRHLLEVMIRPGVALDIQCSPSLPRTIVNPIQLQQIVLDLVTNASDAISSKTGSITIRAGRYRWSERRDLGLLEAGDIVDADDCVFLEVADTGCGIDEPTLRRVFEATFTTKREGHGLGLASVLQIVRGYGGAVTIDSRAGEGTRVRCTFPTCDSATTPEADIETKAALNSGQSSSSAAVTILFVEDHDATRFGSKLALESCGHNNFHVLEARDGDEAIAILEARRDDVSIVVLDWNLPGCRGAHLLRRVKQLAPGLPIVVVSGLPKAELLAQCNGQVPDGLLVKPFDADRLVEAVNSTLRSPRER